MEHEVEAAIKTVEKNFSEMGIAIRHALSVIQGRLHNLENNSIQAAASITSVADTVAPVINTTPTTPVTPVTETFQSGPKRESDIVPGDGGFVTPVTETAAHGDIDDEGVPWNEEFHAKTKTTVNSINIPNGQAWRLKRGVDKEAAEAYKQQFTAPTPAVGGVVAAGGTGVPGSVTPGVVPGATPTGMPGVVPGATPVVSKNDQTRKEIIALIKQLADEFGFSYDDAKTIFEEEFKASQNGEGIIFGGVKDSDFPTIKQYFTDLYAAYKNLNDKIVQVYGWAGSEHAAIVDQNKPAGMQSGVGSVYYQDMADVTAELEAFYSQWFEWAKQNGKA